MLKPVKAVLCCVFDPARTIIIVLKCVTTGPPNTGKPFNTHIWVSGFGILIDSETNKLTAWISTGCPKKIASFFSS